MNEHCNHCEAARKGKLQKIILFTSISLLGQFTQGLECTEKVINYVLMLMLIMMWLAIIELYGNYIRI